MDLRANDEAGSPMGDPPDTEITLGTGKMLVLFFGLVVLCSAFFALGFKLGRGSASGPELTSSPTSTSPSNAAAKPATKPDLSFYKSVGQDSPPAQLTPPDNAANKTADKPADTATAPATGASTDPAAAPANTTSYFVQVAAVSKQEDADALVEALKKKQYAAFATPVGDKLFR